MINHNLRRFLGENESENSLEKRRNLPRMADFCNGGPYRCRYRCNLDDEILRNDLKNMKKAP